MKSSAYLIRCDTTFCIYISIQLRKHHVRTLSTNVLNKSGNLKFQLPIARNHRWDYKERQERELIAVI